MAIVSFSNVKVMATYATPNSTNSWGLLQSNPWRRVKPKSADGVSNVFAILNAAKYSGRTVNGSYDDADGSLVQVYLN